MVTNRSMRTDVVAMLNPMKTVPRVSLTDATSSESSSGVSPEVAIVNDTKTGTRCGCG